MYMKYLEIYKNQGIILSHENKNYRKGKRKKRSKTDLQLKLSYPKEVFSISFVHISPPGVRLERNYNSHDALYLPYD